MKPIRAADLTRLFADGANVEVVSLQPRGLANELLTYFARLSRRHLDRQLYSRREVSLFMRIEH